MSWISPTKSSSRAGRFKKKLVPSTELKAEAPEILAKLAPFLELYSSSQIAQSDFAASYILIYLSHRFPGTWLGASRGCQDHTGPDWRELPFSFEKNIQRRLSQVRSLYDIFDGFNFKSTPFTVNRSVVEWAKGHYHLELMFRIPDPKEVLRQQIQGKRCVSALVDSRIETYILGERDALSFIMHDLIHADHFYHDNQCYQGQLGFYALLYKTLEDFDLSHAGFSEEFEYLIADMNAYAVHLLKCLKSAMIHYFSEEYFLKWALPLNPPDALMRLNTSRYAPSEMDQVLLSWLDEFRRESSSKRHLP